MKKILTFVLTLIISNVFAQTEKDAYKTVADEFENNYNKGNFENIFNSFSAEMQKALPIDKTIEFLSGIKNQSGKIEKREFVKYESSFASYKTTFEKGVFALNISIDEKSKINGLSIKPFVLDNFPIIKRNTTKLILPFKEAWTVFWGGDTKEQNYHIVSKAQKNAIDFVITGNNGKSYQTDGQTNEDYYAYGKNIIAPCNGEIVLVVDGIKDNKPGKLNPIYATGNTVILKAPNDEYLFFAHFKQHSIKVKQGDKVKQGQLLGLCGNSGNSSESHLHFHIQNVEDMNVATGVKCYFDKINVNGKIKTDYSPIKGEIIKPE